MDPIKRTLKTTKTFYIAILAILAGLALLYLGWQAQDINQMFKGAVLVLAGGYAVAKRSTDKDTQALLERLLQESRLLSGTYEVGSNGTGDKQYRR